MLDNVDALVSNVTLSILKSSTGIIENSCRGNFAYFSKDTFESFAVITL